jgi:hypothetical protein
MNFDGCFPFGTAIEAAPISLIANHFLKFVLLEEFLDSASDFAIKS